MKLNLLNILIIVVFISFYQHFIYAQNKIIDSLKKVVISQPDDSMKALNYDEISWQSLQIDAFQALQYADSTIYLSQKIGYPLGVIKGTANKAGYYYLIGNLDKSLILYQKSDSLSKLINNTRGQKSAMTNIANIYFQKGEFKDALALHEKSMEWSIIKKDTLELIKAYLNKSAVYSGMGDLKQSINNSFKAINLLKNQNIKNKNWLLGTANNNLCACFIESGNSKKAIKYCRNAIILYKEIKYYSKLPSIIFNLGNAYSDLNKIDDAIEIIQEGFKYAPKGKSLYYGYSQLSGLYFKKNQIDSSFFYRVKAYDIAKNMNLKYEIAVSAINLAKIYWRKDKFEIAYNYYNKGIYELEKLQGNQIQLAEAYKEFLILKSKLGKRIDVNEMERYIELRDSIFGEKRLALLNEIEAKYQVRQKEDSINVLKLNKQTVLAKIEQEKMKKWI